MPKPGQATANSGQAMPKPGQATPKPRPSHAKLRPLTLTLTRTRTRTGSVGGWIVLDNVHLAHRGMQNLCQTVNRGGSIVLEWRVCSCVLGRILHMHCHQNVHHRESDRRMYFWPNPLGRSPRQNYSLKRMLFIETLQIMVPDR